MNRKFGYADLHCHPNLKTYGHSFQKDQGKKTNVWNYEPPTFLTKLLNIFTGITRFSQSDFTTLSKGGARIIFASLYPFEKGFFINSAGRGPLSAWLSNLITGIGYQRVRNLQKHSNYFEDLEREYHFFKNSQKSYILKGQNYHWKLAANSSDVTKSLSVENEVSVVLSIEGAHVFNSGLSEYGRPLVEKEVLNNIKKVKLWEYPPSFITFAHNFSNDLCGHAHSLEPIKRFVDQSKALNTGFTELGKKVLHELLSDSNGRPIYIDIKHMSLDARKQYFDILESEFSSNIPPTIVSHGAVNGLSLKHNNKSDISASFYPSDINFFDEEIVQIGKHGGLFAIQFDGRRIARQELVKKNLKSLFKEEDIKRSTELIWNQIRHIAEILDRSSHFGWGTACIGSDYDGTIDPLPGVWTAEYFHKLQNGIIEKAQDYLDKSNPLSLAENKNITPQEIADRFFLNNTSQFIMDYFKE